MKADDIVKLINNYIGIDDRDEKESHYSSFERGDSRNRKFNLRLSNHNTYLMTWYEYGDNLLTAHNISITFLDDFTPPTREHTAIRGHDLTFDPLRNMEVKAYVYDTTKLGNEDITLIRNNINNFILGRDYNFSDPLSDERDKKAKIFILKPNRRPELQESVQSYIHNVVMEMVGDMLTEWLSDNKDSYLTVGPHQSKSVNENCIIKPANLINLYD